MQMLKFLKYIHILSYILPVYRNSKNTEISQYFIAVHHFYLVWSAGSTVKSWYNQYNTRLTYTVVQWNSSLIKFKNCTQNGSFNSRIYSLCSGQVNFLLMILLRCPVWWQNPHFGDARTSDGRVSVALSEVGDDGGSLKTADSGSAGFGHSRSFGASATYGRMMLNKYSCRCTDRPVVGTVGGIFVIQ